MRAHQDFTNDLENIKISRINNKLEKKLISSTELTRMVRNTSVYEKMLSELSTIPRRVRKC